MEDNVKGLIRTCCIVLVISVGLTVVYSAKRPYIYLIENYEYYYTPPPPEHPQPAPSRAISTRGRHHDRHYASGNNYNSRWYSPFIFQDIHRHGEVTLDTQRQVEPPEPLSSPPTIRDYVSRQRQRKSGHNNHHHHHQHNELVRKKSGKGRDNEVRRGNSDAHTATTTASPPGSTFRFPIPWDWKARMEKVKKQPASSAAVEKKTKDKKQKEEKQKDSAENTEDRGFRLPRLPTLPPFPTIDFKFETSEAGRMSRSHNPNRSHQTTASKQIQFADIISPETLSFISKLQLLNVSKLAANAGGASIINLNADTTGGSDELTIHNPSVGTPLLSGDFLNLASTKPLIIPKDTASSRPSVAEIEAYHKIKNQFNKPAASPSNRDSEEDDEQEEIEDDEAEDDTSAGEVEGSQQQSEEDQEIGSKSKESKEEEEQEQQDQEQAEADSSKDEEQEQDQVVSKEEEQEQEQEQTISKEEEQDQASSKEEAVQSDEEALDPSDEEIAHDAPSTRTKKKTKRPINVRRPSDTYALASLPPSLQSYSYTRPKQNASSHYHQDNLFEAANVQPDSTEQNAKPVIILVNVPKPTGLKGDTGLYEDRDYAYGDEDKKAKKAEKKKKIKEKKKKKKEKKKKKKKKGWPKKKKKKKGWPPPTQKPNKKADIINRLTKVHSNVQEIFQTFKGVISDYVINRPHVGVEFVHTKRGQPPPHRRPPPPKKAEEDEDDDDEEDWKKEKSGEEKEKSGEMDGDDTEHDRDREKSDDRKLRLPGNSYEEFVEENHYVSVGKPSLWNPSTWSFSYPSSPSASDTDSAGALSKRLQECQKNGRLADCASYVVERERPVKYQPPEPIYVESVVSSESGEKPPRPPFREPPPRISTGSSEKVWVKTWDKEHTGLPLPIDSTELNNKG